jgi:hypothetical protein
MATSEDTGDKPLLVDTKRGRKILDVGNTKYWELIKYGEIETVSIGRKRLAVYSSIEAYVARLRAAFAEKAA